MKTRSQPLAQALATEEMLQGAALLVERDGTVLALYGEALPLSVGDCLYRALDISVDEWQQLLSMGNSLLPESLLFMAGSRPLIAWCALLSRTDLFAVFAPEGELRSLLSLPGAYADALAKHHIALSRGALARYLPANGELPPYASQRLAALQAPIFECLSLEAPIYAEDGTRWISPQPLSHLLNVRAAAMASLFGITLHADWSGVGLQSLPFPDLEWVAVCLFATFLAVRRAAAKPEAVIALTREGADGPVLEICFTRADADDPINELSYLATDALLRNELFELSPAPDDKTKLFLRFSLCRKELAYLSLKGTPRLG